MENYYLTEPEQESAILIGVISRDQSYRLVNEYLDELAFLVETAGAVPVKRFTQNLDSPHPVTFVGSGKLEEIRLYVEEEAN